MNSFALKAQKTIQLKKYLSEPEIFYTSVLCKTETLEIFFDHNHFCRRNLRTLLLKLQKLLGKLLKGYFFIRFLFWAEKWQWKIASYYGEFWFEGVNLSCVWLRQLEKVSLIAETIWNLRFQNPYILLGWEGAEYPTCCRIGFNSNTWPLKTSISMCRHQAQGQKSATKSSARKNLGETSKTPKFHMLAQMYLMCAHTLFSYKYLSGTYLRRENSSTGYPNCLEHFTTFWRFRNLRLLMCNFCYLGGKTVFQWFSGGPKSLMGIGGAACFQKGSFGNNRPPETPISISGHQT